MSVRRRIHCLLAEAKLVKSVTDYFDEYKMVINPAKSVLIGLLNRARHQDLRMVINGDNIAVGDAHGLLHDVLDDFLRTYLEDAYDDRLGGAGFIYGHQGNHPELIPTGNYHQLNNTWWIKVTSIYSKSLTKLPAALQRLIIK